MFQDLQKKYDLFVFHPEDKLPNSIYTEKIHHAVPDDRDSLRSKPFLYDSIWTTDNPLLSAPAALAADQTDPLRSITDLPVAYSHDQ